MSDTDRILANRMSYTRKFRFQRLDSQFDADRIAMLLDNDAAKLNRSEDGTTQVILKSTGACIAILSKPTSISVTEDVWRAEPCPD